MQISVKWIYQQVKDRMGIALEAGQKPTLCFRGRKHMLCVAAGYPIRVLKRSAQDFDRYRDVVQGGKPYAVGDAVDMFERMIAGKVGTRVPHGVTVGARKLLDLAKTAIDREADAAELNEDEFQNEEELKVETPENQIAGTDAGNAAAPAAVKPKRVRKTQKVAAAPASSTKENNVAKAKAKTKGKAVTKKANGSTPASKGAGGFRTGTKKEKAFIDYKSFAKEYEKLERGGKGEYAEKAAKKHGVEVTTMKSWIGGDFARALGS